MRDLQKSCQSDETSLDRVWSRAAQVASQFGLASALPPVMGGGCTERPRLALVFINPTARNKSTAAGWSGARWPWIGTRPVWNVLADAGLLGRDVQADIRDRTDWDVEFAERVYEDVAAHSVYITNLVKWTGSNGDLPPRGMVAAFLPILADELAIVQPSVVVAFGQLPFRALTGFDIKLKDVLTSVEAGGCPPAVPALHSGLTVVPCYFPVGRGNPKAATRILSSVTDMVYGSSATVVADVDSPTLLRPK